MHFFVAYVPYVQSVLLQYFTLYRYIWLLLTELCLGRYTSKKQYQCLINSYIHVYASATPLSIVTHPTYDQTVQLTTTRAIRDTER